ncbi:uncharacterized protein LOC132699280 [Cylas formicarius]|uniref:uncharacterized protein LOC132699280 n=1 Tax=Cylas formicarius TaxID=197179 RepID=UPI002958C9F6|nr:uncharacterized protein LOC132699280 [Cylas formicarius]
MSLAILHAVLVYSIVCAVAFEDFIYVYGEGNKEMTEQGRAHYQMIKERGSLPKYGSCWKAALEHINEGCRYLSEDTQSDIALHITNCFLQMSGHETYNCEFDKKANLRSICINSMSDRAFNVYTEFYTHTQNICWFLRGQIWHEAIAENTLRVGKQLEVSTQNQEDLIKVQRESLELQDRMLKQGKFLEHVMEDIYVATQMHQEILNLLTRSVTNLQTWIVGEVSWIDTIIFNMTALFMVFMLTSSQRTAAARFPLFILLFLNLCVERMICAIFSKNQNEYDTNVLYSTIYRFVWYSRYAFTFLGAFVIIYKAIMYTDSFQENVKLLLKIRDQNNKILRALESLSISGNLHNANLEFVNESFPRDHKERSVSKFSNKFLYRRLEEDSSEDSKGSFRNLGLNYSKRFVHDGSKKYNLRSRQGTPDSGVN